MFTLLVVFNVICMSYGTVIKEGPCPMVTPFKNLDLARFGQGTWFQIARYPNDWENKADCSHIVIKQNNGTTQFKIGGLYKGVPRYVEGVIDFAPEANGDGILIYRSPAFQGQEEKDTLHVIILDIDYDKYAIGYECKYDKATNTNKEFAWIESRTKTVEESTRKVFNEFIKSSDYIDGNLLIWNHFTDDICKSII